MRKLICILIGGALFGTALARDNRPDTVPVAQLPEEARATLNLIDAGGPFPYHRDGITFLNRERRLPQQAHGYYREYTVPTPGSADRGARRIIAGGTPAATYYYTADHYQTFRRIQR